MSRLVASPNVWRAMLVAGMATAWLPVTDRLLYPVSFVFARTGDTTAYLFNVVYSILAIALALAIGIAARSGRRTLLASRPAVVATGIGGAVGVALASCFDYATATSTVLAGIGVVLVAVYTPTHFLFWSSRLAAQPERNALADAALSFVVLSLVFALHETLVAGTAGMAIVLPCVSAALGFACMRDAGTEGMPVAGETPLPMRSSMFVVTLVLMLIGYVAVSFFNNNARLSGNLPYRALIFWTETVLFSVVVLLYRPGRRRKPATIGSFALLSVVFVGMLLVAVFVSDEAPNVGTVPLNCAVAMLLAFAWLLILRDANRHNESPVFAVALYLAFAVLLPRFVQALAMHEGSTIMLFTRPANYVVFVAIAAFIVVCLLVAAILAVFVGKRKDAAPAAGGEPASVVDPTISSEHLADARRATQREAVLRDLGAACGLSERELDIARLALKNDSAARMAQTLFISENTVYSHLKHIYQKTGVHSKREFIELVERQIPDNQ